MKIKSFFAIFCFLVLSCKKSPSKELDLLIQNGTIFQVATFCEKNKTSLPEREADCMRFTKLCESEINQILNRKLDMGIAPVIVPLATGNQIEELLRTNTKLGIRYLEIWKQSIILE
ncbi:hypothetical protein P3G55_06535 [Leptospira sp. 96542]|nr:hypothetical protein [Leptospira sp. 96542]